MSTTQIVCVEHPATSYEEAVQKLNLLQSNAAVIENAKKYPDLRTRREAAKKTKLQQAKEYFVRSGMSFEDLDKLNAIHVTGTKGKGSTCAFIESILRATGLKTGFFSSPHMISVCERIRIDGRPMEKEHFARALTRLHDKLTHNSADPSNPDLPAYFMFLTLMSFQVFLEEEVDVAVIEVGIGGEYDSTNLLRSPVACGFTTLDLDHTQLLGDTLEEIAWDKTGIFKPNAACFVSADQEPGAMKVIEDRAAERQVASLDVCQPFVDCASLGIQGEHQQYNVAVAVQAAREWLRRKRPDLVHSLFPGEYGNGVGKKVPCTLSPLVTQALQSCRWPGRNQVLPMGNVRYFLDGAHTPKSIQGCARWFDEARHREALHSGSRSKENGRSNGHAQLNGDKPKRKLALLFHCTGDRKPEALLSFLKHFPWHFVVFCPPQRERSTRMTSDSANIYRGPDQQTSQSMECERSWREDVQEGMDEKGIHRVECITDAVALIQRESAGEEVDVLVTGSLILIGNVLSVLGYKVE